MNQVTNSPYPGRASISNYECDYECDSPRVNKCVLAWPDVRAVLRPSGSTGSRALVTREPRNAVRCRVHVHVYSVLRPSGSTGAGRS